MNTFSFWISEWNTSIESQLFYDRNHFREILYIYDNQESWWYHQLLLLGPLPARTCGAVGRITMGPSGRQSAVVLYKLHKCVCDEVYPYYHFQWMIQELNVFYLKTVLWVPPNHSLNFYREVLYAFIGACAMAEMYEYLQSRYYSIESGMMFSFFVLWLRDEGVKNSTVVKPCWMFPLLSKALCTGVQNKNNQSNESVILR